MDRFSLTLGIVGPSAGGEWVQNEVHSLIDVNEAQGWDNQLDDELGLVLAYDWQWRSHALIGGGRLGVDVSPDCTNRDRRRYSRGGADNASEIRPGRCR
ncbi:MAG: lipid A-modifier LpxR family protein [Pseudomonadota bacterium]